MYFFNMKPKLISVVVPLFNEQDTVNELHDRLVMVLKNIGSEYEIIFVDDDSTDGTFEKMKHLQPVTVLRLRKNSGQSAALAAGIKSAKGDVIVTIDADLENYPEDIPDMISKLMDGHDVVSGWRKSRWNNQMLLRKIPSLLANRLIAYVSGAKLNDFGCTLRVYRRGVLDHIKLKGEEHRLVAAYAHILGARLAEMEVRHSPRKFGESKYGMMRIFKVLLDVLALNFFHRYSERPIHFFGGIGFASFFLAFISFLGMVYFKYFGDKSFISTPLPIIVAIFSIIGVQFILMGLLAEIFVRQRSDEQKNTDFLIKEKIVNQ